MYLWLERHKSADTMRRKKRKIGGGELKVPAACERRKRADTKTELEEQEFVDTGKNKCTCGLRVLQKG